MPRPTILLSASLAVAALLPSARPADACTLEPPLLIEEAASSEIAGIPTSGIVPIYVRARPDELEPDYPTVTVRDALDAEVSGTFELSAYRLVWRADAPLQPNSAYAMTIATSSWDEVELSFRTSADAAIPTVSLMPGDVHLEEISYPTATICCDPGVNSCGFEEYARCWTQSAEYRPTLTVGFDLDKEVARFYRFEHQAPGASSSSAQVESRYGASLWAVYPAERSDYCLTLVARPLTDGPDVTRTVCQSNEALVELPPFAPEQPDYDQCDEPPVDPETNEPIDTGGGCSAATTNTSGWWLLLLCVAFGARRRRL